MFIRQLSFNSVNNINVSMQIVKKYKLDANQIVLFRFKVKREMYWFYDNVFDQKELLRPLTLWVVSGSK